ncbi:hypothetical protein D9613_006168 [Agrocybe pediades]|uniref:Deacetylase sirtuin-type domain-containing protein n=1 Tax=Agrocybe pediades TaxID=84607 RepID=A0A8H4QVS9_9AGAR|nr:hypothetical protein D9613_006168 [Agrocybe pediades]
MDFSFGRRNRSHNSKPKVLSQKDIPGLAKYIKSNDCKNIVLMIGAGVSTSAGIPDFRSPETGLYSNLARLNLPHPEAVFEIGFFRRNPVPFYTLAHELYPGKFRPTPTHSFIRLLSEKSLLHTCFTQNIDTLERRAGVPGDKIIEAHGSFATQRCIDCKRSFDDAKMKEHILAKKIARCERCNGYVKPDIVFFGEQLPDNFLSSISNMLEADLLIIMGTSLTVQPFASLADMVKDTCPRVLINIDRVGNLGSMPDDVVLLGKCDEIVRDLCKELGWEEDLDRLWSETAESVISDAIGETKAEVPASTSPVPPTKEPEEDLKKSDAMKKIEEELARLDLQAESEAVEERLAEYERDLEEEAEKAKETIQDKEVENAPQKPSDEVSASTTASNRPWHPPVEEQPKTSSSEPSKEATTDVKSNEDKEEDQSTEGKL